MSPRYAPPATRKLASRVATQPVQWTSASAASSHSRCASFSSPKTCKNSEAETIGTQDLNNNPNKRRWEHSKACHRVMSGCPLLTRQFPEPRQARILLLPVSSLFASSPLTISLVGFHENDIRGMFPGSILQRATFNPRWLSTEILRSETLRANSFAPNFPCGQSWCGAFQAAV